MQLPVPDPNPRARLSLDLQRPVKIQAFPAAGEEVCS
jgi:hypothetical protein